jgi:hypothetical protein
MTSDLACLLVGLPGSGKTTFLAALWHVVGVNEVEEALCLRELSSDRAHLNMITEQWRDLKPQEHTPSGTVKFVTMSLVDRKTREGATVVVPDLTGEAYSRLLVERQTMKDFGDFVASARGILLFIHPEKVQEPSRIDQANSLLASVEAASNNAPEPMTASPWNDDMIPTQAQLVDLLQLLDELSPTSTQNVAVVISAWDLVPDDRPRKWLDKRLPLLSQFLSSSQRIASYEVFGLSAQGGDFSRDREELSKHIRASERILVQLEAQTTHDVSAPIRWLLSQDALL